MLQKRRQISIRSWSSKAQKSFFWSFVKLTWFHNICTFFKLSQSHRQRAAHMFLSLLCVCPQVFGLKLFQIVSVQLASAHLSLVCLTLSLFFSFIHSHNICHNIITYHQIIEKILSHSRKKQQPWQAVTKFKPTEQGQVYTLQPQPVYILLQTNPLPLQISNSENIWKYEISLGYKLENDWKSEGSGSTKLDIGHYFFYKFSHQAQKRPSTKLGFIYVENIVNLASMSEHEIQAL